MTFWTRQSSPAHWLASAQDWWSLNLMCFSGGCYLFSTVYHLYSIFNKIYSFRNLYTGSSLIRSYLLAHHERKPRWHLSLATRHQKKPSTDQLQVWGTDYSTLTFIVREIEQTLPNPILTRTHPPLSSYPLTFVEPFVTPFRSLPRRMDFPRGPSWQD